MAAEPFLGRRRFLRTAGARGLVALSVGAASATPQPSADAHSIEERFQTRLPADWVAADYQFTHPAFDTDWSRKNLHVHHGLHLSLAPQKGAENRFVGASLRHKKRTHYGRYDVSMRPAKGNGIVTGFFTYTGPYYGTRHDEIDIEFLGQDTTRLHVAWFVNGVLHNRFVPLGFDAADRARDYGFEWLPKRLRWFADNHLVFEVTAEQAPLPKEPSYLFTNLWAVDDTLSEWAGRAKTGTTAQAHVSAIKFTPSQQPTV